MPHSEHFANVDAAAKENGKSRNYFRRLGSGYVLFKQIVCKRDPDGKDYTGKGKPGSFRCDQKSRRRKDGKQYTIPSEAALRQCETENQKPELTSSQKHTRECFVVLEEARTRQSRSGDQIDAELFVDYDTTVHFISEEELNVITAESARRFRT